MGYGLWGCQRGDMTEQLTVTTSVLGAFLEEGTAPPNSCRGVWGSPAACAEWHQDLRGRAGESQFY